HFSVNSAGENRTESTLRATRETYQLLKTVRPATWPEEECFDAFTRSAASAELRGHHPRVAYIGLGDTDEAAHAGHYDRYLDAAHETDHWLAELWHFLQTDPTYRGRTTLLITTDHGRGCQEPRQWREHNRHVPGADQVWLAALGPDTPPLGEVQQSLQLYQQQVAQTIAQLVGCNFRPDHEVAPAIISVFKKSGDRRVASFRN
ncbi:MAG: phosphoglyceromutase, partial [Saprospiraceae bacterium]